MAIGWDIKRLYFYLVCLVTLIMVIVGTVQIFQGVLNFVYPDPIYNASYEEMRDKYVGRDKGLSDDQVKAMIEKERVAEQKRQKHWQVKSLVNSFALVIVALPIYLYHWRRVQSLEN